MAAAGVAAETSLARMPTGKVTSQPDALRVVEVIELLLDAGQWRAANELYASRCSGGVLKNLPAAWLGQRAAAAFVVTADRRAACVSQLNASHLGYYANQVGLYAMYAGDLAAAKEYQSLAIRQYRDDGDMVNLGINLRNLAECLGYLGQAGPGRNATTEALACDETLGKRGSTEVSLSHLGKLATLAGDTAEAERRFLAADQVQVRESHDGIHLYSLRGIWWADFLVLTGRHDPARALTLRNDSIAKEYGWTEDVARCGRILGGLALADGDTDAAGEHLTAAAAVFRAGDYLTELAATLPYLAEHARVTGSLAGAENYAAEAITIAAPRGLVPTRCAALAAHARLYATRATAGQSDLLYSGRDAADTAVRLAVHHHLAWHELDALRAHALLDQVEGIDHGWAAQADTLHERLVPPGLDPDPLGTVERLVAEQKAAEADSEENED
jgi:hypothetical protein